MFPETFEALKSLYFIGAKGLVFKREGTFFEYRHIQDAYDKAFRRAGLPYSGTHIMRHGGCQNIYNETGDLEIAGQLLGNQDLETIRVYAKRRKSALKKVSDSVWEKHKTETNLVANGRNFVDE